MGSEQSSPSDAPGDLARARRNVKSSGPSELHAGTTLAATFGNRVTRQPRTVVDIQLVHYLLAVFFHSLDADADFRGNAFIRLPFRDQLQHFAFPCRKEVGPLSNRRAAKK